MDELTVYAGESFTLTGEVIPESHAKFNRLANRIYWLYLEASPVSFRFDLNASSKLTIHCLHSPYAEEDALRIICIAAGREPNFLCTRCGYDNFTGSASKNLLEPSVYFSFTWSTELLPLAEEIFSTYGHDRFTSLLLADELTDCLIAIKGQLMSARLKNYVNAKTEWLKTMTEINQEWNIYE